MGIVHKPIAQIDLCEMCRMGLNPYVWWQLRSACVCWANFSYGQFYHFLFSTQKLSDFDSALEVTKVQTRHSVLRQLYRNNPTGTPGYRSPEVWIHWIAWLCVYNQLSYLVRCMTRSMYGRQVMGTHCIFNSFLVCPGGHPHTRWARCWYPYSSWCVGLWLFSTETISQPQWTSPTKTGLYALTAQFDLVRYFSI